MKKYIAELIGTFFLVLTMGMVVLGNQGDFAPLAIGAALMVMTYAGGYISGAHYNPAVTLAALVRGRITVSDAIAYVIVQVAGAVIASYLVLYFFPDLDPLAPGIDDAFKAILAEMIGTFALAYVLLHVTTAKETTGNSYFGLAIGFTMLCMMYAFGHISGGAFNPAIALGFCLMRLAPYGDIWIYLVGCFGGGLLAAIAFRILNAEERQI